MAHRRSSRVVGKAHGRAWAQPRVAVGLALAAAAVAGPRGAQAAGFSVARFGGEHGNPMTDNPTALYYNPAGIGFSEGTHAFVDVSLAWRSATYTRPASDTAEPAGAEGANSGRGTLTNFLAAPMIGVSHSFGLVAVGAGFFTPFGGQAKWSQRTQYEANEYAGPVDGPQRWYTIDGDLRASYVGAGVAIRPVPMFSLGVTGNLVLGKVETIRARVVDGSDSIEDEGRSWLDVSGTHFSFGVGALVEPELGEGPEAPRLRIGASYQSQPAIENGGEMRLQGTLNNNFGGAVSRSDVDFVQQLPDVVRAGVAYRPGGQRFELRVFGDYQRWSVMKAQCVVQPGAPCDRDPDVNKDTYIQNQYRDWHDTFGARVGLSWFRSDVTELFVGIGYASNAVPDETLEPALMDFHSGTIGFGARIRAASWVHLSPSYTQVLYLGRDTTTSRHDEYLGGKWKSPDSSGEYRQTVGVLNVNADFAF
ncbi:MAG: outer membrane protein transport protein [Polyangiaceae bacterium]|nr:outer membrane protein transport protein [Polyangiaceae bacterium]